MYDAKNKIIVNANLTLREIFLKLTVPHFISMASIKHVIF